MYRRLHSEISKTVTLFISRLLLLDPNPYYLIETVEFEVNFQIISSNTIMVEVSYIHN